MPVLILQTLIAGAAGAVVIGAVEAFFSDGVSFPVALVVKSGVLLPAGALFALLLLTAALICPGFLNFGSIVQKLRQKNNPNLTGRILVIGGLFIVALPVLYRIVLFFMTAFHHSGLASLFLAMTLLALVGFFLILFHRLERVTTSALQHPRLPGAVINGAVALAAVGAVALTLLIPPFLRGTDAAGPYGFMGLFRRDGLGAGPLVSLCFGLLVSYLALQAIARIGARGAKILIGPVLSLCAAGPVLAHGALSLHPSVLDPLERHEGLGTMTARALRRLGDRDGDGHSRWLGGRDCDDNNPRIYPGAPEIPDNGIDEDCSGSDLNTAQLRAHARKVSDETASLAKSRATFRPEFPADLSVVLITVDSFRWDAPGFAGNTARELTPNLDALVNRGTVYERAYAVSSYTGQAIPPMFTGKYPSELLRNDAYEVRISGRETFAAETICGEAVKCAAFLSHFLFSPHFGWNQGFHDWTIVPATRVGDSGSPDMAYNSHFVTGETIKWLKNPDNTAGQFFLWAHYMDPHKEYLTHAGVKQFGDSRRDRYDHEVLYTDGQIGRLLDFIATLPAASRILYIVTGDHGEAFGEHGRWAHGKELWEEIIRVPLAVAGPGVARRRIAEPVSLIDLFATLLDLYNHDIPEGSNSISRVPDWVSGSPILVRPIYAEQTATPLCETRRVFIHDGWKLHHLPDAGIYRLYEITSDYERGDSLVETRPEAFAQIRREYEAFRALRLSTVNPVRYSGGHVSKMPLPE